MVLRREHGNCFQTFLLRLKDAVREKKLETELCACSERGVCAHAVRAHAMPQQRARGEPTWANKLTKILRRAGRALGGGRHAGSDQF